MLPADSNRNEGDPRSKGLDNRLEVVLIAGDDTKSSTMGDGYDMHVNDIGGARPAGESADVVDFVFEERHNVTAP